MIRSRRWGSGCLAAVLIFFTNQSAHAGTALFEANQGTLHSFVRFERSGTNLIVTLTNAATADALSQPDILTAVYFDVLGSPVSLTPSSAVIGPTSTVLFGGTDPGGVVGGEWVYEGNLSGAPTAQHYGISSVDLGLFGSSPFFPGNNLQGPVNPDGLQYGLTSLGDNPATGTSDVTGSNALIKYETVFVLSGVSPTFDPMALIRNVQMQYGTELTGPHPMAEMVPEPVTLALLAIGCALGRLRRERR